VSYAAIFIGWTWGVWHGYNLMIWAVDNSQANVLEEKEVVKIVDQKEVPINKGQII
jgi:hypothetical protein